MKGPNAIVSELNLYSSNPKKPIPFEGDKKLALAQTQSYRVDTTVNVEEHLPVYTTVPYSVPGVYNPVLSLNGTWQFNPSPKADFYTRKADTDGWYPIVVPGQWSMQGFKVDSFYVAGGLERQAGEVAFRRCIQRMYCLAEWKRDRNPYGRYDCV